MAILNPDHLLEQAARLVEAPPAGPPRQADVRRAISAAYYAVFHSLLTAAADELVGKTWRRTPEYGLAYRSMDHGWIRQLCTEVAKPNPARRIAALAPPTGFGPQLQALATAVVALQERRHEADYDPLLKVKTADALSAIRTARSAIRRLDRATAVRRKRFLTLLVFQPR